MTTVVDRFASKGRLTPENKVIAQILDEVLAELIERIEKLERKDHKDKVE